MFGGGAFGSLVRFALSGLDDPAVAATAGGLPWATLAANVVGCAVLGAVVVIATSGSRRWWLAPLGGAGVAGGLTTMSTLGLEVAELVRLGSGGTAALYVVLTLAGGIGAAVAAGTVARRWSGEADPTC